MNEKHDKSKESIFIEYLDANNLHGWAMSKYLPYGSFRRSSRDIDVLNIPDDSSKSYILEVDLSYPKSLHDYSYHLDFPIGPENQNLPKLLTTLYDKEKVLYIIQF